MNKKILIAAISLLSINVQAAHFGIYQHGAGAIDQTRYVSYRGQVSGISSTHYLCTDTHARKVPGRITSGVSCEVEWQGDEYSNKQYLMLLDQNYTWVRLTTSNKEFIMERGVTPGVVDDGNFVYHCKITFINGNTVAGKYVPSQDGCFYGWYGDGKYHRVSDNSALLEVLTNIPYTGFP